MDEISGHQANCWFMWVLVIGCKEKLQNGNLFFTITVNWKWIRQKTGFLRFRWIIKLIGIDITLEKVIAMFKGFEVHVTI